MDNTTQSPESNDSASAKFDDRWQPIETAPKGDYIIGAWRYGDWWCTAQVFNEYGEWVDVISDRIHRPTHWAPLPEEPNT